MKSLVILAIGMLLGVVIMLLVPHGAPQIVYAGSPSGNGDVNGDGRIDIGDAVYVLSYLFAHGPEPEAIECVACDSCCPPVCPPQRLPATGQTQCYGYVVDQGWVEVPCTNAENPGQDGSYQTGCPTAGRFVDNADGTVTDNCTGLMWQKDTADVNGDGQIRTEEDGGDAVTWPTALQYCENLTFAGHADWRLPNVRELQSIVDYGRFYPSMDPEFGAVSSSHWSSSTTVVDPNNAWYADFFYGVVQLGDKGVHFYVRAVRDAR